METTDCTKCRKRIYKEAETAYLSQGYEFFQDAARTMAVFAVCGALTAARKEKRCND